MKSIIKKILKKVFSAIVKEKEEINEWRLNHNNSDPPILFNDFTGFYDIDLDKLLTKKEKEVFVFLEKMEFIAISKFKGKMNTKITDKGLLYLGVEELWNQ